MYLNDLADDEQRQRLLPFVTRLACADSSQVEKNARLTLKRAMKRLSFDKGLEVLEGALRIGRQAEDTSHDDAALSGSRAPFQVAARSH
jgi:hypothetical protein